MHEVGRYDVLRGVLLGEHVFYVIHHKAREMEIPPL